MPILEARGVRKVFATPKGPVATLDGFNLAVEEGEFLAILGPSGCGKSTFLHMAGGFDQLSGGEILVDGKPIDRPGRDRGMMFQGYSLFPWATVAENIAWPMRIGGVPEQTRAARVGELLTMIGLPEGGGMYPAQLSGGMKQRVALARMLALEPRIMLMDEPFGALDAQNRELLQEELGNIWAKHRRTVLFVTHDIDEAVTLATRVVVFSTRPARIKLDLQVDREGLDFVSFRKSQRFFELRTTLWEALREEVIKAREVERVA
ncbi:ABC transporter ATP-binding protein [Burkholderia sp. Ax-1724]|uniref:ABC transporter ATP-binding protein n=1 Tax=Burkholderia sp. Ax-1724 TaxID=2608336 RepID=UPI00141F891C|nr:ABC transporter ATP-binding protein [Burkholderia sp. Ax-1724]NIF52817.1 ABC transporter ATP-binding protein [Burkholderia sp. Ax-1724]